MTQHSEQSVAAYPTTCPECGGPVTAGQRITRLNAFEPWRHGECPRTKFDFDPGTVCPDCFTVRATTGACSC